MFPSFQDPYVPIGLQNGVNQSFTLTNVPNPISSLEVWFNGSLLAPGVDYTLSGNVFTLIFFRPNSSNVPPDVLLAAFRYGGSSPSSPAQGPYDNLTTILNTARVRLGDDVDSLLPLGGQLASDTQSATQQRVNSAWRKLQQFLASHGYVRLRITNYILLGLPPVNLLDTSLQVSLSWSGYSDGVNSFVQFVLPQNLIKPLALAERQTILKPPFAGNQNAFLDIDPVERIPSIPKGQWNLIFAWDGDQITMPGTSVQTDLRVDYAAYLSDFADTGDVISAMGFTPWYQQVVPITRALDPFANYICAEVERARGNMEAVLGYTSDAESGAMTAILGKAEAPLQS